MALLDDTDTDAQDYGNLFGGPGQSLVGSFLGPQGLQAAQDNSLLSMGAQMMQAGAKSTDPSHGSILNVLGSGIGAGETAYQGSIQRGLQSAGAAQSLRSSGLQYLIQLQRLKNAQALNPGSSVPAIPGATPAAPSSAAGFAAPPSPTAGLPPGTGQMPAAPMGAPGGAMPGMGATPMAAQQPAGTGAGGPAAAAMPAAGGAPGGLNPDGMPPALASDMYLSDPSKYYETQAAGMMPTDFVKNLRAAGIDPTTDQGKALIAANIAKQNYIQPTRLQGGGYVGGDGQYHATPSAPPAGYMAVPDPSQQSGYSYQQVGGGTAAVGAAAAAKASGAAQFQLQQTYDPSTGQMVYRPVAQIAAAAGGAGPASPTSGLPAPLRNNNPGALMTGPGGTLGQYPSVEAGMAAMDKNLADYGASGTNTVASIVNKWNPPNGKGNTAAGTQAYVEDVAGQLGIDPHAPLSMTDPTTRHALALAMANHENGRQAVAASGLGAAGAPGAQAPAGGPMAATAPLGIPQRAQQAQEAAPESMQKDYESMNAAAQSGQQTLASLARMQQLAAQKTAGPLGALGGALNINSNATEYEKQRANVIATMGAGGTDAARAVLGDALPAYGKPTAAQLEGIQTQVNQVQQKMLRSQFLTPAYTAGDPNTYTTQANAFDQHVSPTMMPILAAPPGPQQKAAVLSAIKANPALRTNFQWALDNGLLK